MLEKNFQAKLIKKIKETYPESIVIKNDASYIQGIPDLLILNGKHWAALEVKKSDKAKHRPNQDYYISKMDKMSFAKFISPENKDEVLDDLKNVFK